ncbi:MAG: serine/threonine-protein kinase [Planctomycetota bacterium]
MPEPFDSDNIPTSPMPPVRPAPGSAAAGAPTIGTPATRWSFTALASSDLQPYFPNIEILSPIGQGGMGAVYKARQISLDRVVALKILPPEVAYDPAFSERFSREGKAMARLNHPNVVGVFDSGRVTTPMGELYFFVMEFVDGPNLRGLMVGGHIKPTQAVEIVGQICEALHYAHDEGLVHRDIKPENVLIDQRLRIKVADFGLAKIMTRQQGSTILTRADGIMGTPQYMAPEQVETPLQVDARADIYSVGVLLYEMLTGGLPMGRFDAPSKSNGVPIGLDAVVFRSLEKNPARRFATASEMKRAMNFAMDGATAAPAAAPRGTPESRRSRWFGLNLRLGSLRIAISVLTLAAVATISAIYFRQVGPGAGRPREGVHQPTGVPPPAGPITPDPPAPPLPIDGPGNKGDGGRRLMEIRRGAPALSDHAAELLALTPVDRGRVDVIIRTTLTESVRLERGASKVAKGERAGGVRIQISQYAAAQLALRTKFATDLGAVLNDAQKLKVMEMSRKLRPGDSNASPPARGRAGAEPRASDWQSWASASLNPAFGELFPKADEPRTIDIWRDKDRYFFAEASRSSAGTPLAGDTLAVVPARYRAYWLMYGDAPAEVKELIAEIERDLGKRRMGDRARFVERIRSMPDGEARIRRLLDESGADLPPAATLPRVVIALEQLVRSLQGLPELEEPESPK